jgi:thioredoxin-related protein
MVPRRWVLSLLICAAAWQGAAAQGLAAKFDPRRDAAADVAQALAQAAAQGKRVIVDVGGEWCAWCHILDRFIARNDEVQALIEAHFIWVKVNWSPANRNERLLGKWPKVSGYPHLFVLDGNGRVVRSQPTAQLESGKDYDQGKMLAFLQASRAGP